VLRIHVWSAAALSGYIVSYASQAVTTSEEGKTLAMIVLEKCLGHLDRADVEAWREQNSARRPVYATKSERRGIPVLQSRSSLEEGQA
jgi:hypothetical protein